MGEPTAEDILRAEGWLRAKEQNADIWTHLSDEQREMIEARIAWACGVTEATALSRTPSEEDPNSAAYAYDDLDVFQAEDTAVPSEETM